MVKTGFLPRVSDGKPPLGPGFLSAEAGRSLCPMQGANLERVRRIAFCLKRRQRRGSPEFRYWLRLERAIAREGRRVAEATRRRE